MVAALKGKSPDFEVILTFDDSFSMAMNLRKPYLAFCDQLAKRVRANPAEADGTAMVELRRFCAGRDPQSLKSTTTLDWKLPPKMEMYLAKKQCV